MHNVHCTLYIVHCAVKASKKLYILTIDAAFIICYNIITVKCCNKKINLQEDKIMKKIISLFLATIVAAVLPFTCSAEQIVNPYYVGTYWNTSKDISYIDIQSAKCYAIVVYSPDDSQYIKGSTNNYSITDKYFTATFSNFSIVNSSGGLIMVANRGTQLVGNVSQVSNNTKTRIKIGSYNYEK